MRNFDLSPLMRQWIGFDKLANALQNAGESQSFPPYNIEKSDDNHYRITLALAGFRQEDLEIQLEGTRLSVKGTPEQPKEEKKWLHQGLMNQPFSLSFTLAENMEVSGATFVNGLLHIDLIRNEPEPIAAQRIAISERPDYFYVRKGRITSFRPCRPFPERPSAFLVYLLSFPRSHIL